MFLITTKSVSACSYLAGSNKSFSETMREVNFYSAVYFFSIFFLFLLNFGLFIWRDKKDYLFLILLVGTALIMIPLTFFGMIMEECSFLLNTLKWEFIFILAILVFHIGLWITKRNFPTWQIDNGEMNSLKLE